MEKVGRIARRKEYNGWIRQWTAGTNEGKTVRKNQRQKETERGNETEKHVHKHVLDTQFESRRILRRGHLIEIRFIYIRYHKQNLWKMQETLFGCTFPISYQLASLDFLAFAFISSTMACLPCLPCQLPTHDPKSREYKTNFGQH